MGSQSSEGAPNVVTVALFKTLIESTCSAEVVCVQTAEKKSSVWYGGWIIRVVDPARTSETLLVPARHHTPMALRSFRGPSRRRTASSRFLDVWALRILPSRFTRAGARRTGFHLGTRPTRLAASVFAICLAPVAVQGDGMVLVMQGDGSLRASTSQSSFARNYNDGIGQGAARQDLAILGDDEHARADGFRTGSVSRKALAPTPEILSAIDDTALRYAAHPGLRRAGITVTEWRLLFRSNIEIESAYNPAARSRVGAIGLGQLMPDTARALGVDPHDWRENLDGSARYLAQMLAAFGDVRLALAAYNAGPDAVARHEGIPPYRETQNHVRRVLAVFNRLEGETA